MAYLNDREFSDRMIPHIKRLVGPYLLDVAPEQMDVHQATDLIVLHARDMRIAARVRRFGYAERYPFEFTLRSRRDNGVETELSKIVDGWGDWFFYSHADQHGLAIELWWLIDLHAFRAALIRERNGHRLSKGERSNGDGTHFVWFDLRSFPSNKPILVASSRPLPSATVNDLPLFRSTA